MTKQEVQLRVSKDGKPLDLSLFEWDENTNTFSSAESGLVLDFRNVAYCTFKTGSFCTFDTGYYCTFKTGSFCTFDTGYSCTFDTGYSCTFKTGDSCTFDTGYYCTFKTGDSCTFKTGSSCTFKTGEKSAIVRRDIFEVIILENGGEIQLCPYKIAGYLTKDGDKWMKDGEEYIIIDGILSKVISHKGGVYKVLNHGEREESYIVTNGIAYSHGKTIKDAKESLMFKISDRNVEDFKGMKLTDVVTLEQGVQMYRKITGSCESQTKSFVQNLKEPKESYTISEIIKITEGQFGNNDFQNFFNN